MSISKTKESRDGSTVIFAEKDKEQLPRTIRFFFQNLKVCTTYLSILNLINLTYRETHLSVVYGYQGIMGIPVAQW